MIGGNKMYICLGCGRLFDEPNDWEERHGFDYGPFEKMSGCPYCGEEYVEARKCDCCDEWIEESYIKLESGERICECCYTTYEIGDED
jgi:hypothetical protein